MKDTNPVDVIGWLCVAMVGAMTVCIVSLAVFAVVSLFRLL